jgi:hypothetical protein
MSYQYAYLLGDLLLLLPIWLLVFYFRRDLRIKLLSTSLFGLLITPFFVNWYTKDYWYPETIIGKMLSIEDFLFGFLISGVFSSLYLIIQRKTFSKKRKEAKPWIILVFLFLSIFFYSLGHSVLSSVNSIYLTSLISLVFSIIVIFKRKDLAKNILITGTCAAILHLCGYLLFIQFFPAIFDKWWMLDNLSYIQILSIPIEELIWAFGWGMVTSSIYEIHLGLAIE